jgi:ribonuclease D
MRALLRELLASSCPKVFQNGQAFDVPILEANGFTVTNYIWDTLLMQHIAYAEMQAGLEHMARLYCGVNGWKHTIKGEQAGEWK